MKIKFRSRAIIALTVAAMMLIGTIALAAAPARASGDPSGASQEASAEQKTVNAATVDEFLAAIGPNTDIVLEPKTYDLSTASDYGKETSNPYYHWEDAFDGYELVIGNVQNLSIRGSAERSTIAAVPRHADVLEFTNCIGITLAGFIAGHTVERGQCSGGVIHLENTDGVTIQSCALYGCGILGVAAENCQNILVTDTDIYECSYGAVQLVSCRNVQFDRCVFRDCYDRWSDGTDPVYSLIDVSSCYGVAITDGYVHGNYACELVNARYSQEVYVLGTLFEDNSFVSAGDYPGWDYGTVFYVEGGDPIFVAGCEFRDDAMLFSNGRDLALVELDGSIPAYADLVNMKQEHIDFAGFEELHIPVIERTLGADGMWETHVSTVDEFLAAIAPDTTVYLDEGLYDLSEAMNYGTFGGQYYYWEDMYDGPGLVISGVENFSIVGAGKDATRIESLPRYAAVIEFSFCQNISVRSLTAGHTLGAGICAGAVLNCQFCDGMTVSDCGLFGCGIYGVMAFECTDLFVTDSEIYECSYGAVSLDMCNHAVFENNDIHDCAYPTYYVYDCTAVTIDGKAVNNQELNIDGAGPYRSANAPGDDQYLYDIAPET